MAAAAALSAMDCGGDSASTTGDAGGAGGQGSTHHGSTGTITGSGDGGPGSTSTTQGAGASSTTGSPTTTTGAGGGPTTTTGAGGDATTTTGAGGGALGAGWLYTSGAQILVSNGQNGGSPWMGRGVNFDDLFLCGYDNTLWMTNAEQTLETMVTGLVTDWKPSFVRVSLGMDSYPVTPSWVSGDAAQYKTPMTNVIRALGSHAGVYVLVTLRSDASMIGEDTVDGDAEATGLPSDATNTPDSNQLPTGTDATYEALVDTFASDAFVLFGITNEPGGNKLSNARISAAMSHAVSVIRAEEDALGVPHHIVSVQGNGWTSDISFYASAPLPYDNVVYEVHGYPPAPSSYTYANIPVILGEYGSLTNAQAFYADVEAKQIPNMAWDFDSFSDCSPDLLQVNQSASNLQPTPWGDTVKSYLNTYAP
jgi:hypothetical protein